MAVAFENSPQETFNCIRRTTFLMCIEKIKYSKLMPSLEIQ